MRRRREELLCQFVQTSSNPLCCELMFQCLDVLLFIVHLAGRLPLCLLPALLQFLYSLSVCPIPPVDASRLLASVQLIKTQFCVLDPVGGASHHTAAFRPLSVVCLQTDVTARHLHANRAGGAASPSGVGGTACHLISDSHSTYSMSDWKQT